MTLQHLAIIILLTASSHVEAALPDPTRPPQFSVARTVRQDIPRQHTEFSVNAIRISEADRSAVVNGQIVRVGQSVGNAIVKEINLKEVILDYQAKVITVPLFSRGISFESHYNDFK